MVLVCLPRWNFIKWVDNDIVPDFDSTIGIDFFTDGFNNSSHFIARVERRVPKTN